MSPSLLVADCPECRGQGTVVVGTYGVCMACFAEFRDDDETISRGGERAGLLLTCLPQPVEAQLDQHQSPSSIVSRQMRLLRESSIQSE
jgi:hypothetical protein